MMAALLAICGMGDPLNSTTRDKAKNWEAPKLRRSVFATLLKYSALRSWVPCSLLSFIAGR